MGHTKSLLCQDVQYLTRTVVTPRGLNERKILKQAIALNKHGNTE